MKKTMIAMAVAGVVAAPIASADVTVSGTVEQTFTDTDNDANGIDSSTDSSITFKGSEDLGNGMTAFAQITLDTDADTDTTAATAEGNDVAATTGTIQKDSKVGISADFGTIVVGRMEDFSEGKLAATMTFNGPAGIELGGATARNNGAIAYVSPTFSGVTVGLAGYTGTGAADDEAFDATDVMVSYANGPFTLAVAQQDMNAASVTGTVDEEILSVAASYTMGNLKLSALAVDFKNAGGTATDDSDDFMARLDYTIGNNKISIGSANDDSAANDITAFELTHSLSSRTKVYVGAKQQDVGSDNTYAGMIHNF